MAILNPSVTFQVGDLAKIPVPEKIERVEEISSELIQEAKCDWDQFEGSFDFEFDSLVDRSLKSYKLSKTWENLSYRRESRFQRIKYLEEENNRLFIEAFGLQDKLTPDVPEDQITLARADREKDSSA